MSLSRILTDIAPNKLFIAIVLGVGSGLLYSLLIPLIMVSLEARTQDVLAEEFPTLRYLVLDSSTAELLLWFVLAILGSFITSMFSSVLLMHVTIDATSELRRYYYRRIAELPVDQLYLIGQARLVSIISTDTPNIVTAAISLPRVFISAVTAAALLAFVAYIDVQVFLVITLVLGIGTLLHYGPVYFSKQLYAQYRLKIDSLLQNVNGLIYGAKELKLNSSKREYHVEQLLSQNEADMTAARKQAEIYMSVASAIGGTVVFVAVGILLYVLGYYLDLRAEQLITLVMALLYLASPINTIVFNVTAISRGNVSLEHMQALLKRMTRERLEQPRAAAPPAWSRIHLRELEYRHPTAGGGRAEFKLGPVSLDIHRGEVLFIVGGNGSGKTTLGKLIALLYVPASGTISFDAATIDDANRQQYRESISAIFSDYFLFQRIADADGAGSADATIRDYLEQYGLDHKIEVRDGRLSSLLMSDGQRRRLALIAALLERREVLVFDEWAADQDVEYKETFYRKTLPQLRGLGKTVIVITHDDRYFAVADRLVRMEHGRVTAVLDQRPQRHAPSLELPRAESPMTGVARS